MLKKDNLVKEMTVDNDPVMLPSIREVQSGATETYHQVPDFNDHPVLSMKIQSTGHFPNPINPVDPISPVSPVSPISARNSSCSLYKSTNLHEVCSLISL